MRSRPLAVAAILGVSSLTVALAVARNAGSPRPAGQRTPRPLASGAAPVASPELPDLAGLRDVFRFADEREAGGAPAVRPPELERAPRPAPTPSGPRLVGLVRRSGRLVAALTLGGEVELAGPGESAAGVTVVAVSDDSVRIRNADGSESTLVLP